MPTGRGVYAATLTARVGPVTDTYRGSFAVEDVHAGSQLRVRVEGRGRSGRMRVELAVMLRSEDDPGTTLLRYAADATVSGSVARLERAPVTVAGNHFTGCFFPELARSLRRIEPAAPVGTLV